MYWNLKTLCLSYDNVSDFFSNPNYTVPNCPLFSDPPSSIDCQWLQIIIDWHVKLHYEGNVTQKMIEMKVALLTRGKLFVGVADTDIGEWGNQ